MRIRLRRITRFVMPLFFACSTFVAGVSTFYFYAEAAAFLFKPKKSTPKTTQSLTTQVAAPPVLPPSPPPVASATPYTAPYYSNPVCENCIEDDICGLCEPLAGDYMNYSYNYTLTIPGDLRALKAPEPAHDHGFIARLSADPEAIIEVEGVYNEGAWKSLNEAVNAHIEYLRASAKDISVLKRGSARLGKRPAMRYVIQYTSISTGLLMIEDKTIALRKDVPRAKESWIIYGISLRTPAPRYEKNVAALEKVLKRWKEIESGC